MALRNDCEETKEYSKFRWIILLACFLSAGLYSIISFAFGAFVLPWKEEFSATGAQVSAVTSCGTAVTSIGGLLSSFVVERWGYRWSHATGGAILMISFGLTSFARSLSVLFFTYGILGGLGNSLCLVSFINAVSEHFEDIQELAFSIVTSAFGIGSFIFPLYFEALINSYGWRGAMFITCALLGNSVAFGLLLYPIEKLPAAPSFWRSKKCKKEIQGISSASVEDRDRYYENTCVAMDDENKNNEKKQNHVSTDARVCSEEKTTFVSVNKKILLSSTTYITAVHNVVNFMGVFAVIGITPLRASYDLHLNDGQVAILIATFGANGFFRIFVGIIADRKLVRSSVVFLTFRVCLGFVVFLSLKATTFELLLTCCLLFALFYSSNTHYYVLILKLYDRASYNLGFGYMEIMHGIGSFAGPIIGGLLFDMTGTCSYSFIFAGLCTLVSAFILPLGLALNGEIKKLDF